MSAGGAGPSVGNRLIYSIQQTYILTLVFTPEGGVLTCNQRIDIPTCEPLPRVQAVVYQEQPRTVVPCIELECEGLDLSSFAFETNEGVTVLPVKIESGFRHPLENPYLPYRYVLVLPRGTTGIKACKVTQNVIGVNIQHNLTFGIMPPPYNYDNALFGYISYSVKYNSDRITELENATLHYGYATQKAHHTIDFSDIGDTFLIDSGTRFLTFRVTNPLEASTAMNIVLTSDIDPSKNEIVTCKVAPGQNDVKVDLQVLAVFVENDTANKADSYIIPPMQDDSYGGIRFGHNVNASLPGSVQVTEWA